MDQGSGRMSSCEWLTVGGWIEIDTNVPCEEILEVVQHIFDHIPSSPDLMSLHNGPWPAGVWHWEPEGHASSVEPTHYRRLASAAAWRARRAATCAS